MSNKDGFPAHSNRGKCESPEHDIAIAAFLVAMGSRLLEVIELEDGRYDFRFDDPENIKPITHEAFEEAAKQIEAEIEKLKTQPLNCPQKKLRTS